MKQNYVGGCGLSPFFCAEDFLPTRPSVTEDVETEILVIGAGVSGLLCAYELLKQGRRVTVVTANTVGDGASRFSTGVVSADGGLDLLRLKELIGLENAVGWYRFSAASVTQLEKIVADIGSKCDFVRRDQFYYTHSRREASALREEYYARHHVGLDCEWNGEEVCREGFSFPCVGGILTKNSAAQFNVVKFCRDLTDWILLHGGTVYEGSRIETVESCGDGFSCRCNSKRISAKSVVDARGGEALLKRPSLGQRVTVFSVATEPLSVLRGWREGCVVKSRDELSYLRVTPDRRLVYTGQAASVLTPEGRSGKWDVSGLFRVKYNNLSEELEEMFFGIPRVKGEYRFAQSIVLPKKGLPYVGRDDTWKGLYYLYAFGENGISGAVLGAAWIRRMICDGVQAVPQYLSL